MDKFLYLAMHGAAQAMQAQQNNAHNLANVSTIGFKGMIDQFQSKPVHGPGHGDRVYASDDQIEADLRAGPLMTTGRELDIAINGEGWFSVQASDGSTAFSRRGDLHVDSTGLLQNGADQIVLGASGPITLPQFESLVIGRDGTISIRGAGQSASTLVAVDRLRLVKPPLDQLSRGQDGLFRVAASAGEIPADASVSITSGALESSNVNAVDAMVRMMEYARYYEHQVKLMNMASENDAASARLLRMNG